MATCLTIVQTVMSRLGIGDTNAAVGATDEKVKNIVALLNEEGQELSSRYPWTAITDEVTFTTVATEDQGSLDTIAPGLNYILNDTIWNRSLRRPVFGPKTSQGWQQNKAFSINGPWSSFRIKGNHLLMYPVPSAGQSCYFEGISRYWLTDTTGATGREYFTVDTDIPKLDWQILVLGTIWRWKKLKGLEYAEDFNTYERRVLDGMGRDGSKDWLSLTNTKYDIFPGVVVPAGSWNL